MKTKTEEEIHKISILMERVVFKMKDEIRKYQYSSIDPPIPSSSICLIAVVVEVARKADFWR